MTGIEIVGFSVIIICGLIIVSIIILAGLEIIEFGPPRSKETRAMTASDAREIWQTIKDKGVYYVIVGLTNRVRGMKRNIDAMQKNIDEMHIEITKSHAELLRAQAIMHSEAQDQLWSMMRTHNGLDLIEFETKDVYAVNKRLERLQREMAELKNMLNGK